MECRCVCKLWMKIIDCDVFWIKKFSQKNLDFATSVQNLPMCFYRDIYNSRTPFKQNLIRNGDCSMKLYSQSPNKFPYWLHVGNFHSNWSKKLLGTTSIPIPHQLQGSRACFSAELTHGPNEMHQKISLQELGISMRLVNALRPTIQFTAWVYIFSGRWRSTCNRTRALFRSFSIISGRALSWRC